VRGCVWRSAGTRLTVDRSVARNNQEQHWIIRQLADQSLFWESLFPAP